MGTRSLTILCKSKDSEIAVMYRQADGYPEGHGIELANWLSKVRLTNGLSDMSKHYAGEEVLCNGMGCLTAQLIRRFFEMPGGIYLYKRGKADCWEEFVYSVYSNGLDVTEKGDRVRMTCKSAYGDGYPTFDG